MCGWEWFPNKRATASGVLLAGYASGPFLFGFISTALVNPDDLKPVDDGKYFPVEVANRVPRMLRISTMCWAVMILISLLTVKRNPRFVK